MTAARLLAGTAALAMLAGCQSSSMIETGETASVPTPGQIADWHVSPPATVNPYIQERRAPRMKNGCSTAIQKKGDVIEIPAWHPDEVYCFGVAPLRLTDLELPAGARLHTATSGMQRYLELATANTVEKDIVTITSKCTPPRKDENGVLQASEIEQWLEPQALPHCPRPEAELTVVMTTGIARFRLWLNQDSHHRRIVMREEAPAPRPLGLPVRPGSAQDLYAKADGDEVIPWVPDDAWASADSTVVVWHRPISVLPAMALGPRGEQAANPTVINANGSVAMVYTERVTAFQLRLDDRILTFSDQKPRALIEPGS